MGLSNVYGNYYDGVLFCSFVRQKSIPQVREFFDLELDWHIMFAHGKVLQVPGRYSVNNFNSKCKYKEFKLVSCLLFVRV